MAAAVKVLSAEARVALKALFNHGVRVAIVGTPSGPRTLVGGNSYPIRETLKRLGFGFIAGKEPKWSAAGALDLDTLLPALLSAYYVHEDASAQQRVFVAASRPVLDRIALTPPRVPTRCHLALVHGTEPRASLTPGETETVRPGNAA